MDINVERETVSKVEDLIQSRNFGQICFEVGKFIEAIASEIYFDLSNSNPKNAKTAIDFLIEKRLISRPLGYKLHVIREMRNVEAHNLPYPITTIDAQIAIEVLNQTIEWLHQGNLAREWQEIHELFNEGENAASSADSYIDERETLVSILNIYRALEKAVALKIRSLNLQIERMNFFSSVELLSEHGIDVKSTAWRKLVEIRNRVVHPSASDPSAKVFCLLVQPLIPELRDILGRLNPLDDNNKGAADYPQVRSTL